MAEQRGFSDLCEEGKKKFSRVLAEYERGNLKSSNGEKVTSREQARAIGFSEARKKCN